jgi:hypothetical protein
MLVVPGVVVAGRNPTPRHPVWIVDWLDASDAFPSWAKPSSVKAGDVEQLVQSVGYLVPDVHDDHLTLATSCVETDDGWHFGGGIHIPLALVRRKVRLA